MSDQEKQGKIVFSWQVFEEEDGSFRSEVHASPDWQEHKLDFHSTCIP